MWDNVVQDWLQHLDIFSLELIAISNRHNHKTIKDFLTDSRLADDGDDNAGIPGVRLRAYINFLIGPMKLEKDGLIASVVYNYLYFI